MKILIVDDNAEMRTFFHDILQDEHEVALLGDGGNAISLLSDTGHGFDVVFLDINMPRMSGNQVVDVLNLYNKEETRFVIITGDASKVAEIKEKPNVISVEEKPFGKKRILEMVAEVAASGKNS